MNANDENHDKAGDEEQIAKLLAASEIDAPPPDRETLAVLRGQSSAAFAAAPSEPAANAERKRPPLFRKARWLAAAAAVVLIGVGLYSWQTSGVALGQVLDKVESAETLHARFSRDDTQVEFWHTRQPNQSRWDYPHGKYNIAQGTTLWLVNEPANKAHRSRRDPEPSRRPLRFFLDGLRLPNTAAGLLEARPVERVREGNRDLLVYRGEVASTAGRVWFEAQTVAETQRLYSIRAWHDKDGSKEFLGELTIIAYDEPIGADKFVVADTLTEDGRIGKVADVQGIVTIKPVLHDRWTPVRANLVLRPGDWVRTDARGANATALHLVKKTGVILGPKTLVELIGPKQIRLIEGQIEITPSPGAAIELLGPGLQKFAVKDKQLFRIEKQQLARVAKDPPWLLGFKGATANEALGSLVALVDGRNVPLTVGYHKVTVDIRDQIARTVIEESFVNHTDAQLEGVFHFPLPQDASISGFGMWIGDKLVEADVVEKQRAREIYETILRERRDPGLLEWSGGNIFKARVFPILPNSEKRIKITYTQVLPLKGNRYRYSYALQSELLQQHPLRELSIDVKVNSVVPLKSVSSPTHTTRDDRTLHSAHVEFTAQEYTPTRDFEVVVEVEGRQADVVMIPHRRGDDGYFMLQLTPPGANGGWDRPVLPNGEPLQLLILADTSASIDAGQRANQATFIGALLAALSPADTFNLATCDVACDWAFAQAKEANASHVTAARDFLAKRSSLGWTDLDGAFASALKRCGPKTHVVYVGDGIVTTGDADPVAFTKRLRRLWDGLAIRPRCHAVALGSSYEPAVLKAIASLGGGSMRKITSEQGPPAVARELLGEIAQPGLRDVKVEFKGFKVARVYPETLANVQAGTQQILLGRYLPEGGDQSGEVIVTGTQGDKPVRFSTHASFKDAEHGNSFIPRLWARMHLDSLLEQGSSTAIKDEIIALSEEFQIITPYTSLLVLETDADRERFKVKRRFQMRDGERFFADGRDNAVFDLAQKQMKRAGAWRTALRRSVLGELARLGREPRLFQPARRRYNEIRLGILNLNSTRDEDENYPEVVMAGSDQPIGGDGGFSLSEGMVPLGESDALGDEAAEKKLEVSPPGNHEAIEDLATKYKDSELGGEPAEPSMTLPALGLPDPRVGVIFNNFSDRLAWNEKKEDGAYAVDLYSLADGRLMGGQFYGRGGGGRQYGQWLNTLFPPLHGTPRQQKEPKSTWPVAALDLAKSLLRTGQLAKMTGGIEIAGQTESFDVRWDELAGRSRRLELVSAKSWLTRSASDGGQTLVSWCDGKEIGVFSKAYQLGRVRAATPLDVQPAPLTLSDYSLASLERAYSAYTPTLEPQGKDRMLLVLKHVTTEHETRILIDTSRHVILSIENRFKDEVTGSTRFDDFVEAAGSWWAQRVETTDAKGKRASLVTQAVKTLTLKELDQRMQTELAGRSNVQLLHLPMPTVKDAKKAIAAGKASADDHFVLMLHFLHSQQWTRVFDHLQQVSKLAAGKPGLRWLHSSLLYDSRRHEELRRRYQDDAARLVTGKAADANFLAEYIVGQSAQIFQANEMLALLDTLKPLYEKQPPHLHARKRWAQQRVSYLAQAGRSDEVLRLHKQLAIDYPHDYGLQQQYAQALAGAGEFPAAYAWLTRVLVKEAKWLDYEEERLRNTYAEFLHGQGRYKDLVAYLAEWVAQNPAGISAYQQYLSALIHADQIEKADALALRWLKEAEVPGILSPPAEARLEAAVYLMRGNVYRLYTNRVEERWLAPLAQAALFFALHEVRAHTADLILSNDQFSRSEEAGKVRKKLGAVLIADIDKLPAEQVRRLVGWVHSDDVAPAGWDKIIAALRTRWKNEAKDDVKHVLGQTLVSVLSGHGGPNEPLAFLRLQWQSAPENRRAEYANQLFNQLLAQPWSAEFEAEAFALLDKLSTADEPGVRLFTSVAALHRLTDTLLASRIAARTKTLEHPEKLTRTELHKKQDEYRRQAREGLADRLRKEAAKQPKALAQWLMAESLYFDVLLDRNLKQAAAEAWEFVGAAPPKKDNAEPTIERALDEILRQRYLVTLTNLAARKGAEPALVARLLKYFDAGITGTADADHWKLAKYRLLVAFDRSRELEQALRQWAGEDDADNRWRVALGYLLAEQGRVAEAILQFEAVETTDELGPSAYRALADWYLVQNKREAHERAARAVYKMTPEHRLSQMIAFKLQPWQHGDGHLPTVLDKEVLRMFAVLFDKSATPQSYLYQLQQFYQASHDFRLLAVLPDAVIGHTAARVYPFVQGMDSVLTEVRDEATADELVKRIGEIRPRAGTAVDQRALDLLEVLVERRAAEVQNQPGPHVQKALAALRRAFKRAWSPGEPRLMADFLAGLGKIAQPALADEQLGQLKALHAKAAPGSLDRLHIGHQYATTRHSYNRAADAIDLLQSALDEFQGANDGVLPVTANNTLASFIGYLEGAGHFARGEKALFAQLAHPAHAQQRRWLIERLDNLYLHALQNGGEVSLGKNLALYHALNAKVQKDLADTDQNHRYQLLTLLCQVYRTAYDKKLPGTVADLQTFAFAVLPPLLKRQTNNHDAIVSTVANTVGDLAGPRDGIVFLLNEIEGEPRWLRYTGQDGWSRHATTLADWRRQAKDLGDVENRLLKLVLKELRHDLETRQPRNRVIYYLGNNRYWKEKAADFAKTAEAVLAERRQSGAAVQYIADYFYWGLDRPKRAIEILFVAYNQKLLDETGEAKLVDFLRRESRYGESIAVLQPLVERRPENLEYRVLLMHAYFRTDRKVELLALLKQTDTFFHEKGRWGGHPLSRLAQSTLQNELYDQSVAYFKELIPLHERTQPGRGIGNGTLAGYYVGLSYAYAGLKKTPEAVEAAGGAMVAWGARRDGRTKELETLKQVLLRSPDLDAFVAHFDKQKQDSAIVRKALGQAYHDKKQYAKAIKQLELAAALQPNDAEIWQLLVASLDATGDKEGAIRQLLQAVQLSRRDLKLYEDLGKRYTAADQAKEAERAYTSIVEVLPTESESHALLAEIREKQNRWADAIAHWEQVARLRALEPTGLLKLAAARIHEKQWDQASAPLRKLDARSWPPRFGDVRRQVRTLEEQIAKQRKK
jgi:Flp pilus assembly protein TadD